MENQPKILKNAHKQHPCTQCDRVLKTPQGFRHHMERSHAIVIPRGTKRIINCPYCPAGGPDFYPMFDSYIEHLNGNHRDQTSGVEFVTKSVKLKSWDGKFGV